MSCGEIFANDVNSLTCLLCANYSGSVAIYSNSAGMVGKTAGKFLAGLQGAGAPENDFIKNEYRSINDWATTEHIGQH